jgi:hypothetical protein
MAARTLSYQDLEDILNGAAIIACGGGGPISVGQQIIDYFKKNNKTVQLLDPKEFGAKDMTCVSAFMGSPDAAADALSPESITSAAVAAFEALQKATSYTYKAVTPGEVGAGNSFVPMTVAAEKGIPVLDVDGAGRAIPSLTQVTYASHQVPVSPMVLGNTTNVVTVDVKTVELAEQIAREIVSAPDFGQDGGMAFWSMNGKTMRDAAIHNTMTYALNLGTALRESKASKGKKKQDPVTTVINYLDGGKLLFVGKISSSDEVTSGGFDTGRLFIKNQAGQEMIIYNQNENLMAWNTDDNFPLILAPDMISFIATDGTTFTNASGDMAKVKGKEIAVIGSRARAKLRDSDYTVAAFMTTLRQLGYGGKYFKFD